MIANPCFLGDKDCEILSLIAIIDPGATLGGGGALQKIKLYTVKPTNTADVGPVKCGGIGSQM